MNAELKAKWVEALRSGRYRQGRGRLRADDRFCCLGVLCRAAGLPISRDGTQVVRGRNYLSYDPIDSLIGVSVSNHLFHMNDMLRRSFPEIADYIEANL